MYKFYVFLQTNVNVSLYMNIVFFSREVLTAVEKLTINLLKEIDFVKNLNVLFFVVFKNYWIFLQKT